MFDCSDETNRVAAAKGRAPHPLADQGTERSSLPRKSKSYRHAQEALQRAQIQQQPEALLARLQNGAVFMIRSQKPGLAGAHSRFLYPCFCWLSEDALRLEWCHGIFRDETAKHQYLDIVKVMSVATVSIPERRKSKIRKAATIKPSKLDGAGDIKGVADPTFFLQIIYDRNRSENDFAAGVSPKKRQAELHIASVVKEKYGPNAIDRAVRIHELWLAALEWLLTNYGEYLHKKYRLSQNLRGFDRFVQRRCRTESRKAAANSASQLGSNSPQQVRHRLQRVPSLPPRDGVVGSANRSSPSKTSKSMRVVASMALDGGLNLSASQMAALDAITDEICEDLCRQGPDAVAQYLGVSVGELTGTRGNNSDSDSDHDEHVGTPHRVERTPSELIPKLVQGNPLRAPPPQLPLDAVYDTTPNLRLQRGLHDNQCGSSRRTQASPNSASRASTMDTIPPLPQRD